MDDELLFRLFQRHFADPAGAVRRLDGHLLSVELPFDFRTQLRELTFPPQPGFPNGLPSFIYYFIPNTGRGTENEGAKDHLHPSFINTVDGIGLNLGCPVRLLRSLDVLSTLSPQDQEQPRAGLRHAREHLSAIEELLWLTGWKSPSSAQRGGRLEGMNGDVDWKIHICNLPAYLEAKFRRSDWPRLSDGKNYDSSGDGFLSSAAHKFPVRPHEKQLHIVGITMFDNIDEGIFHAIGRELENTRQIHAVVLRSLMQMTHIISLSVEARDRVLSMLETPLLMDYPLNYIVNYNRQERDKRVAAWPARPADETSLAVGEAIQPQGVLPFMPKAGMYRINISSRGKHDEPIFEIAPQFLMK